MSELQDVRVELVNVLAQVDEASGITAQEKQQVEAYLGQLWQKTEGVQGAHALIDDAWTHIQAIAEQNDALTFQVVATSNIAKSALAETNLEREARQELEDAIDSNNEEHPRLHDFSQTIRADAEEEYQEGLEEWVLPEVRQQKTEEINQLLFNTLTYLTGCPDFAIAGFMRLLKGRQQPTEYQLEMLKELVASFGEMKDASE